jgi:hypothetical protein
MTERKGLERQIALGEIRQGIVSCPLEDFKPELRRKHGYINKNDNNRYRGKQSRDHVPILPRFFHSQHRLDAAQTRKIGVVDVSDLSKNSIVNGDTNIRFP